MAVSAYRSIDTYIWNDDKFPYASDDCQLVWFHIFTNPLSNSLGCFRASLAGLAEDKHRNGAWPIKRYQKAFREALAKGFFEYDEKTLLLYFPKFFDLTHKANFPRTPNVVKAWGKLWNQLPDSPLKTKCYHALKALLEGFDKDFLKAFHDTFHAPLAKQPERNLTQEQEQEQEQRTREREKDLSPSGDPRLNGWGTPEHLIAFFNREKPPEIPAIKTITAERLKQARLGLQLYPDLDSWVTIMGELAASDWLRGRKPSPGYEHWKGSWEWLFRRGKDKTQNLVKLFEGQFRGVGGRAGAAKPEDRKAWEGVKTGEVTL